MTENCFDVLGIAPTKDEKIIKKAYRTLLRSVNPEDDMQGFQRLRGAYEEACRYAAERKTSRVQSASEQFIERCREVYASFERRINPEEWETLFSEPVCLHLDTEEEVRRAFLTFLMEHFHFPAEVWQCIDRAFRISGERKSLTEWFPEDFVDYLQQAVRDEGVLNYSLFVSGETGSLSAPEHVSDFDGDTNVDAIDSYIDIYFRLRQYTDLGLMEQAAKELEELRQLDIFHPYGELEEARILLHEGKKEEAGDIFIRLGEAYPEEERIACCYGQFLQMEGRWEEIRGLYDNLLLRYPDSPAVKSGKAEELLHDGAYREAREMILDLLEYNPQDERLMKDLTEANVLLIEELEAQQQEGMLSADGIMDLGWCYYQNLRFEESLAVLDAFTPDTEHLLDYHNLKGRVYLTLDRNEEALEHLTPWLAQLLKLEPDGTKKTQRRLARLGYAYYTIGSARVAIALRDAETDADTFAETMEYFEKAIAAEQEEGQVVSYYHTVADIWRQRKEYGKVVDACDRMLQLNQGYYPAILLRQEACLQLGMYQEVADDYQRAVHMYPYYGRPYATLIKMYFMFGEYEKIKELLDYTEKNNIKSDALRILTARYLAVTAKKTEDLEYALGILNDLQERGWEPVSDVEQEEWSEIPYRRGLILTDLGRLPEAKKALSESMEDGQEDVSKLFSYAAVLMQSEEYDQAVIYLTRALHYLPDDEGILYRIGWCHKLKGSYEEALAYFQRARKENPQSVLACNNAGNCYLSMNQPQKAEEFFLEAVRLMKNEITPLPYNNLAKCYRMMGDYEAALLCYRKNMELFSDSAEMYLLLGDFYRENEEYGKAIAVYEEGMSKIEDAAPLEMEMLRTYGMKGDSVRASSLFHRLKRKYPEDAVLFQLAGEVYLFGFEEGARAVKYLEEALRLSGVDVDSESSGCMRAGKENADRFEVCGTDSGSTETLECIRGCLYLLGRCHLFLREEKKAVQCFRKYLEICRGKDGLSRRYEEFYGERGRRKFRIGCAFFFMRNYDEAEKCFQEMYTDQCRCDGCSRTCCYEILLAEAMMLWARGEKESALEQYKKAAEKVPDDIEHIFEYKQMKKWEEAP